jgi:hypothetical protein
VPLCELILVPAEGRAGFIRVNPCLRKRCESVSAARNGAKVELASVIEEAKRQNAARH